jgi:hypothetical protein
MLKKLVPLIVVLLSALAMPARAFWKQDITMLVVPREALPVQIAQDISRRYPVLLVCYQTTRSGLRINAWNGDTWVYIPIEDYTNGTFFATRPGHAIVVEYDRTRAPRELTPNSIWCKSASRITSTDPRVLLHLLGTYFNFPLSHWEHFATRYNYTLEEINPGLLNVHWWNMSSSERAEKRAKSKASIDLDKWRYLATIPPPAIAPVVVEEASKKIPEAEVPAVEPVKVIKATAPETPAEKVPALKPAPEAKPVPPAKPTPAIIVPATVPALKPAAETKPTPSLKPEPVIKPAVPAIEPAPAATHAAPSVLPEPAPLIDTPADPSNALLPVPAPLIDAPATGTDPFSMEEMPAAEIVVPPAPKKPWWKKII